MDIENLVCHFYHWLVIILMKANEGKEEKDQRHGGYMCVWEETGVDPEGQKEYHLVALNRLGTPPIGKLVKYCEFAQEKVERLSHRPSHLSSWQSRDTKVDKWGGAIKAGKFLLSFSGLPELDDEALCLLVAVDLGLLPLEEARTIALTSNNVGALPLLGSIETACAR